MHILRYVLVPLLASIFKPWDLVSCLWALNTLVGTIYSQQVKPYFGQRQSTGGGVTPLPAVEKLCVL